MTTPGAISWVGLLTLMVDGPDLPVRGVISSREGDDPSQRHFGWTVFEGQPLPVFAGFTEIRAADDPGTDPADDPQAGTAEDVGHAVEEDPPVLTRVWRSGRRVRLEHPDGRPSLIVGDERCWQFRGDDPVPVESASSAVAYQGNGTQLLHRRQAGEFTGDDFTRPTGPVGQASFLGRPAYTVELLRTLRAVAPAEEFWFIVGGDMAHSLPTWREPESVLALARLAVAEREGVARGEIAEQLAGLAGGEERVSFFTMPRIDISSSLVRRRVAIGASIRYLVPDAVAAHIEGRGLYAYPGGTA